MPYFYLDPTYLLILPCLILSLWAQFRVQSAYRSCSRIQGMPGLTGAEVAARILSQNGVYGLRIERIPGQLNDHYDPSANVIRLSDAVYGATDAAAIGVAAHEAGHAVQYARNYAPIKLRAAIVPVVNFGSKLAMPLFLIGLLLTGLSAAAGLFGYYLALAGVAAYALTTIFQLVTLPVELDASRRAMAALSGMNFRPEALKASRKMLSAAALTYVAALATSLMSLLRLLIILGGRNDRR